VTDEDGGYSRAGALRRNLFALQNLAAYPAAVTAEVPEEEEKYGKER